MTHLPRGWTEVALGDVCEVNPKPRSLPGIDEEVAFLGMASVHVNGTTDAGELRRFGEVSKGYTQFERGDVLVAKITPCFENGKIAQADPRTPVAAGSTEFHVVRPREDVDARYVLHYLRQPWVRLAGERRMTGSGGQRRVPASFVATLPLPLPPLDEQRRIAAILDKADELRAKRRSALDKLESLTQSIFLDMFGDPVGNSRAWPRSALGEVAATASGGTPDRAEPRYFGGAIRWVKSGELHSGVVVDTEETLTPEGLANSAAKLLPPGTLLVAMYGATAGVVATLGVSAATNQAVCSITPGPRIDGTFLTQVLRLMSRKLLARRHGGAQPNLSQKVIRHLEIPVPPLDMQTQFAQTFDRVKRCAAMSSDSAERADALLASLQSRAFRGEL